MSRTKDKESEVLLEGLEDFAWLYIDECLSNTKTHVTPSGKEVEIKDRHIPTINYFLRIWLVQQQKKTICKKTWYNWLNNEPSEDYSEEHNKLIERKKKVIQNIDELFKSLSIDIVANEGKGIFYAKNKLGMTDRVKTENETKIVQQIVGMTITNEPKQID